MNTDRELLELAAKAAGLTNWKFYEEHPFDGYPRHSFGMRLGVNRWNALTDDGDALRLAVKLHIKLMPYPLMTEAKHSVIASRRFFAPPDDDENTYVGHEVAEPYGDDPAAATRRAIVRAAAEIGRSMA